MAALRPRIARDDRLSWFSLPQKPVTVNQIPTATTTPAADSSAEPLGTTSSETQSSHSTAATTAHRMEADTRATDSHGAIA